MTSVLILLSGFDPGTYFVEDDGIAGNGIAQLRSPDGSIIFFNIPTESLTIPASAGRSVIFNLTESFGAADIIVGDLANSAQNPDFIQVESIAGAGDVMLVSNGTITEVATDAAPDIVSSTLILSAATGVGAPGNALETQVQRIEAETVTGGINLANLGDLFIGGLTGSVSGLDVATSGDLTLVNFGSILISDQSVFQSIHGGDTSGNVTLIANGFDSDLASNVDLDAVAAPGGDILLQAGRDVSLGTLGPNLDNDVRARGNLTVLAGRDVNVDGFADLASDGFGVNTGGNVVVTASRDINILNSTGTDASIGAEGTGGGDVFLNVGAEGFVRLLASSSATLFSSTGNVSVQADRMIIGAASGITAGNGIVTLATASNGRNVDLGSATDGAFALELSDAELDRVFTPNLLVGGNNAGFVSVTSAISPASAANLIIRSGTSISVNASITATASLSLRALDNVFQLAASTITTPTLTVFVDSVDDDPGTGGTAILNGTLPASNVINGNLDNDTLNGSGQGNILRGFGGNDVLRGFGGADTLDGGFGADSMFGGLGDDDFIVMDAGDLVFEAVGEGFDEVFAHVDWTLNAGANIEILQTYNSMTADPIDLTGNLLTQTIFGNAGPNTLDSGGGGDTLAAFGGNDFYVVRSASDLVDETVGAGNDRVFAYVDWTLNAGSHVEIVSTYDQTLTDPIDLAGNALLQTIIGNEGANILDGGGGGDSLVGIGGDDWYVVRSGTETVFESAGAGNDRVFAYVDYVLSGGAVVETLSTYNAGTSEPIDLAGNDFNQTIYGNAGGNYVDGRGGIDVLFGDAGADVYAFTSALGMNNIDTIVGFQVGVDKIGFAGVSQAQLAAGAFRTGTSAQDADDRIIYNPATGALFYDGDGNGAGAQLQFATLMGAPPLSASDFTTI